MESIIVTINTYLQQTVLSKGSVNEITVQIKVS